MNQNAKYVGLSLIRHELHRTGDGGMPGLGLATQAGVRQAVAGVPAGAVVMVHGFQFDPRVQGADNPHRSIFPLWQARLARPAVGFGWFSAPLRPRHIFEAWLNGRYNRYRWAWDMASIAGGVLRRCLAELPGPVNILCHSLGSRVVLTALEAAERLPVERVILLNGADYVTHARYAATKANGVRFTNIVVKSDDVLAHMGELFAPGRLRGEVIGRSGVTGLSNWTDVVLDDPDVQTWGRAQGFDLRGDNPGRWGDHWYSYLWDPNWRLYNAIFAGRDIDPLDAV